MRGPPQRLRREVLIALAAAVSSDLSSRRLPSMGSDMRFLGPYNRGGAGKLLADFMNGLAHGSPIFWAVALGPYVMTLLVRLLYAQLRGRWLSSRRTILWPHGNLRCTARF